LRQAERRIHEDIGKIHEAIETGEISHEEARKKLSEFHDRQKKESREREWKMIKGRIEGAVREGKMSRGQANEEYERIERRMHGRDKIAREANERVRETELEIHEGLEAGEISHEEARQAIREVHEEMNYVVRRKHLELELQEHERRIEQALESGVISKSQAEEKRIKVRQRLTKQFRIELGHEESNALRGSDEREGRERHHEARYHSREREGREDRRHHEEERELWEAVRRGLDAAVRLGKLDREEAREIWEDFRSEDEEAFEEEDLE
jgi:polyhydroxyalkanoate synthesis regulator phasin